MDASVLHHGLTEYVNALRRQLSDMREQGERMAAIWGRTREVYQGRGAEDFRDAYERSARMLEHYVAALEVMTPILEERLRSLGRFDSGADPRI